MCHGIVVLEWSRCGAQVNFQFPYTLGGMHFEYAVVLLIRLADAARLLEFVAFHCPLKTPPILKPAENDSKRRQSHLQRPYGSDFSGPFLTSPKESKCRRKQNVPMRHLKSVAAFSKGCTHCAPGFFSTL